MVILRLGCVQQHAGWDGRELHVLQRVPGAKDR